MEIVVPVKMVPDVVEELEVDASGKALDGSFLKFRINEYDEHAVEEALLLKEQHGGKVTVVALDAPEVDDALFTCLAKGADRALKVTGAGEGLDSHRAASILASALKSLPCDLVLTGVQAIDDRDGQLGPLLAGALGVPHVSVVSSVVPEAGGKVVCVKQEYAGGLVGEMEVDLPAVIGIQAAQQPPRYAPVSKVRQIMKTTQLDELAAAEPDATGSSEVLRLFKPEAAAGGAEMLEGSPEEVADKLFALLQERGLLKA
jgi:electron transfer flavoprotein beta subunit